MLPQLTALAIFALHFTSASPLHDDHAPIHKRLPGDTWYHDSDHPAHALFRRQSSNPTDGGNYAAVGSSGWYNAYPPAAADTTKLPQAWVNALNAAVSAGKIPNIPPSTSNPSVNGGNPTYPNGLDPTGKEVCSGTYKCRIDGDVWDAPQGTLGCGFDDGYELSSAFPRVSCSFVFLSAHFHLPISCTSSYKPITSVPPTSSLVSTSSTTPTSSRRRIIIKMILRSYLSSKTF